MPSCSDVVLLALVIVGSISTVHTAGRPFIPNVAPLNCAFCMSVWTACGVAAALWSPEAVLAIPVTGGLAAVSSGLFPWAFYSAPVEAEPGEKLAPPEVPGKV